MLTSILIILVFFIVTGLMVMRKLPTLLALPLLAVSVATVAGVPLIYQGGDKDLGILNNVIQGGATKLAPAYCAVIMGAWLGQMMNQVGISKAVVKIAAELGGDKPFLVTVLVTAAIALLFTTISGLGAVIMIATIAVPIMISVGVPSITAACMVLFGMATGLIINISNWAFYTTATGVQQSEVQVFALTMAALTALTGLIFVTVEFKRNGVRMAWASHSAADMTKKTGEEKVPLMAMLTPLVPVFLVVAFHWPILPAFAAGLLWCFFSVYLFAAKKNFASMISLLTKAAFEGITDSAPAVLLMMGIGMVLNSFMHPVVAESITPFLKVIIPGSMLGYILFFALLSPLALYRGPLNMWGLGSGVAAVIISLKILPAAAVLSAFLATERVQVIGDPTNTHNVWLSNFIDADVNKILLKVLPYIWCLAVAGIVIAAVMWF